MKATAPATLGFSFSPGGLLLPYHLGVMDSLTRAGHLTDNTPLAGSSAGAIAVACHACGLSSGTVLDATLALSEDCVAAGGTRGRLIPALRRQMQQLIGPQQLEILQARPGAVGIAYQEIFPRRQAVVQTDFLSLDDLMDAVSFSSTFPFFSDRWPVAVDRRQAYPRLVVDGFFTVPRDRLGCPDLNFMVATSRANQNDNFDDATDEDQEQNLSSLLDQPTTVNEVLVACFPQKKIGLTAVPTERCISPTENALDHAVLPPPQPLPAADASLPDQSPSPTTGMANFIQVAMEASPASTYFKVYEQGLADGEAWSLTAYPKILSSVQEQHSPLN